MSTTDIRNELRKYIEIADGQFLNILYETATQYITQKQLGQMIKEGEEDIKEGRTYSIEDAKKIMLLEFLTHAKTQKRTCKTDTKVYSNT